MIIKVKYVGSYGADGEGGSGGTRLVTNNSYVVLWTYNEGTAAIIAEDGDSYKTINGIIGHPDVWVLDSVTDIGCMSLI